MAATLRWNIHADARLDFAIAGQQMGRNHRCGTRREEDVSILRLERELIVRYLISRRIGRTHPTPRRVQLVTAEIIEPERLDRVVQPTRYREVRNAGTFLTRLRRWRKLSGVRRSSATSNDWAAIDPI